MSESGTVHIHGLSFVSKQDVRLALGFSRKALCARLYTEGSIVYAELMTMGRITL